MVKIITDSASDMEAKQAEEMGIILLPMTISFGDEDYKDKFEITADEFYEKLVATDDLPRTSQINPFVFEETFQKIKDDGDEAIVILLSSGLSGTYNSALTAADGFDNIYVLDSLSLTVGEQCLIKYALQLVDKGLSAKEIFDILEAKKKDIKILAILDTLEYLKKGGRISPTVAFAGGLLNIKPVVTVEDGKVVILGKARGTKNGNNMINDYVSQYGGIDYDMPAFVGYTGCDPTMLEKYIETSKDLWNSMSEEPGRIRIGSTIGTHVGPGAVAVGYFIKH